MSFFAKNQSLYTLKSASRDTVENAYSLLRLEENGKVTATGSVDVLRDPNVYFYVSQGDLIADVAEYQLCLKPYSQRDKFIAVVDGKVALKTESECTKSERSFYSYKPDNEDFWVFYVEIEETSYYLSCNNDGDLYASATELDAASWFHMQLKDEDTVLAVDVEELFFEANLLADLVIAEVALAEE